VNWAGNLDVSVAYQTMDRLAIPWNDQLGLLDRLMALDKVVKAEGKKK